MRDIEHLAMVLAQAAIERDKLRGIKMCNPYGAAHQTPKRIIIHAMGEYILDEYAPDFLLREQLSAHALGTPDGKVIRLRDDTEGAWHAKGFNTDSLGYEVLLAGHHNYASFITGIATPWVTDAQYDAVVRQCREWVAKFGITQIDRHSDVSPGRKCDPGAGFPWEKFLLDVKGV